MEAKKAMRKNGCVHRPKKVEGYHSVFLDTVTQPWGKLDWWKRDKSKTVSEECEIVFPVVTQI